eukprot:UC1_evm1s695
MGIALVAMTELSFSSVGFTAACFANCCFVLRSVFAKRLFADRLVDNLNLFYYVSWLAAAATLPLALALEGHTLLFKVSWTTPGTLFSFAANGILHYAYNQCSLLLLGLLPALTHSIGNATRRFVIIGAATLHLGTPLTPLNLLGVALLVSGVVLYARSKATAAAK